MSLVKLADKTEELDCTAIEHDKFIYVRICLLIQHGK